MREASEKDHSRRDSGETGMSGFKLIGFSTGFLKFLLISLQLLNAFEGKTSKHGSFIF